MHAQMREYAPKGDPPAFNFNKSSTKLSVWAGVCSNGLILGRYFFHANVDGRTYLRMLNDFAFPQLANHFNNQYWEGMFRGLWWAQDRLLEVRDRLNKTFDENRVVSFDLTPCDFFLWGFSRPLENVQELQQRIIEEFNTLRQRREIIQRALRDMHRRTILCVEISFERGEHVEGHGA